jgi:hypothetical protein
MTDKPLPPQVRRDVQRILDAAARRLLEEGLKSAPKGGADNRPVGEKED